MTAIANGLRVKCVSESCDSMFIVTRGGDDELICHGKPMEGTANPTSSGSTKFPPFAPTKEKCYQCDKDAILQHPFGPWFCSVEHDMLGVHENAVRVNALGKRYRCFVSGAEMLCLKPGKEARVDCQHHAVWFLKPKVLPSAD